MTFNYLGAAYGPSVWWADRVTIATVDASRLQCTREAVEHRRIRGRKLMKCMFTGGRHTYVFDFCLQRDAADPVFRTSNTGYSYCR